MSFASIAELREACGGLSSPDVVAASGAKRRQAELTKPPGSLGRLEDLAVWLAEWQGTATPDLTNATALVFAGNHGVAARGVSAFPTEVTAQMVANFANGGAAINQLAALADADLRVVPLELDDPTEDFTRGPAMTDQDFVSAINVGWEAVPAGCKLLAVGEMGIGNTTVASALCAALAGGHPQDWIGRGTGVADDGLARKENAVRSALRRNRGVLGDPLASAAALGGRELSAIFGAVLRARAERVPVLLDGFVACAAVLPLFAENREGLLHCQAAHRSAEAAHARLLAHLGLNPLLDMGMRLGEASGAALAITLVRAALACHAGMASFSEARVSNAHEVGASGPGPL